MQPKLALYISFCFIGWLFVRDRKLRPMTSGALWITLLWIFLVGSRPFAVWLGGGKIVETPQGYLEGNPLDAVVLLLLTLAGFVVLLRRRLNWYNVFASNYWITAFVIYCGISIIWSDYPFVSFKRYIKEDIGNVIMALIIVTDRNPAQAFKAVFARFSYLAISLSVVFIKYFPELGRYYNRWTWEYSYCGITGHKNELGYILFICGLVMIWDLSQIFTESDMKTDKLDLLNRVVLLLMMAWLISLAHSSTALTCLILGTAILLLVRTAFGRRQVSHLGTWIIVSSFLAVILVSVPGSLESLAGMAGRDITLTGRTEIWTDLLKEQHNPILGSGFHSFWLGPGAERMWAKYYFHPVQAHNGYLETYLNGGLVGVCLLMAMLISTGRRLKKEVLQRDGYGMLLFAFFIVILFYNITEAMFSGSTLIWVVLLIAALKCQRLSGSVSVNAA